MKSTGGQISFNLEVVIYMKYKSLYAMIFERGRIPDSYKIRTRNVRKIFSIYRMAGMTYASTGRETPV